MRATLCYNSIISGRNGSLHVAVVGRTVPVRCPTLYVPVCWAPKGCPRRFLRCSALRAAPPFRVDRVPRRGPWFNWLGREELPSETNSKESSAIIRVLCSLDIGLCYIRHHDTG